MNTGATCTAARWLSIVGIGEDGVEALSPVARQLVGSAELVVGGGVRGVTDLAAAAAAGCNAALVATALYDGRLVSADLAPPARVSPT